MHAYGKIPPERSCGLCGIVELGVQTYLQSMPGLEGSMVYMRSNPISSMPRIRTWAVVEFLLTPGGSLDGQQIAAAPVRGQWLGSARLCCRLLGQAELLCPRCLKMHAPEAVGVQCARHVDAINFYNGSC